MLTKSHSRVTKEVSESIDDVWIGLKSKLEGWCWWGAIIAVGTLIAL